MADDLDALRAELAEAVAREDFERAAQLRDAIAVKGEDGAPRTPSRLRRQVPGQMGLGADRPAHLPPEGWTPPKKPDPMTRNAKPGGRRRR